MYFASYDYPVAGRSNMTIYAHQVATLGSIFYSEVPLSSSTVVSTHIPQTKVPCQLDCMQSTSSVISQPSTFMLNTGNAVSTRRRVSYSIAQQLVSRSLFCCWKGEIHQGTCNSKISIHGWYYSRQNLEVQTKVAVCLLSIIQANRCHLLVWSWFSSVQKV